MVPRATLLTMGDVAAGVYRHWKGRQYLVLGTAHDANVEGREVVVYVPLYVDETQTGPRLAVRTVEDFTATTDDGQQRFAWIGTR